MRKNMLTSASAAAANDVCYTVVTCFYLPSSHRPKKALQMYMRTCGVLIALVAAACCDAKPRTHDDALAPIRLQLSQLDHLLAELHHPADAGFTAAALEAQVLEDSPLEEARSPLWLPSSAAVDASLDANGDVVLKDAFATVTAAFYTFARFDTVLQRDGGGKYDEKTLKDVVLADHVVTGRPKMFTPAQFGNLQRIVTPFSEMGAWLKANGTPGKSAKLGPAGKQGKDLVDLVKNCKSGLKVMTVKAGARLLHQSATTAWIDKLMGGIAPEGYSFTTAEAQGWALGHSTKAQMLLKFEVLKDMPVVVFPKYGYKVFSYDESGGVDYTVASMGGPWGYFVDSFKAATLTDDRTDEEMAKLHGLLLPPGVAPGAWIGSAPEREIVLQNRLIPRYLKPVEVYVSVDEPRPEDDPPGYGLGLTKESNWVAGLKTDGQGTYLDAEKVKADASSASPQYYVKWNADKLAALQADYAAAAEQLPADLDMGNADWLWDKVATGSGKMHAPYDSPQDGGAGERRFHGTSAQLLLNAFYNKKERGVHTYKTDNRPGKGTEVDVKGPSDVLKGMFAAPTMTLWRQPVDGGNPRWVIS